MAKGLENSVFITVPMKEDDSDNKNHRITRK